MKLTDLVAQIKPYVSGWLDSAIGAFSLSVQDMLAGRPTRREMEDPGVPALRVGSGDDFLDVDTDGAISLVGDAMPWDDLRVEPVARRLRRQELPAGGSLQNVAPGEGPPGP